jgi:hypothetical protein
MAVLGRSSPVVFCRSNHNEIGRSNQICLKGYI